MLLESFASLPKLLRRIGSTIGLENSHFASSLDQHKLRFVVSIKNIRCEKLPFYVQLGYGGMPISDFPPHRFFQIYLSSPETAIYEFCLWYEQCFIAKRGYEVPTRQGGWRDGSLMRTVVQLHKANGVVLQGDIEKADPDLLKQAIRLRAMHYFGVLDSIRTIGFISGAGHPIAGVFVQNLCYLHNGHHRVSALSVLGYGEVPVVVPTAR